MFEPKFKNSKTSIAFSPCDTVRFFFTVPLTVIFKLPLPVGTSLSASKDTKLNFTTADFEASATEKLD